MSLVNWRTTVLASAMALTAAVVSAQSAGGGLQPQPGIPSNQMPGALQGVEFEQRLNETLPLDLVFKDEDGREVRLGQYFNRRPVVLAFVYYECPMLCSQVMNGVTSALTALDERVGADFEVVAVSFDPRETPVMAAAKKKSYVDRYNRDGSASGFHFLTGSEASIKALTAAAGFKYAWDEQTQQFAHASGFVVATPDRQAVALLLRHRIRAARHQVRAHRVVGGPGRIAGRPGAALLLSLRSQDGLVFVRGYEGRPAGRRLHPAGAGGVRGCGDSTRLPRRALKIWVHSVFRCFPSRPRRSPRTSTRSICSSWPSARSSRWRSRSRSWSSASSSAVVIAGEIGARIEGNLPLELLWSIIPTMISMVMFGWGASAYFTMRTPPAETMNIYAVGKQWMWKFQHVEGQREINELHVPLGRPIKVTITSEDVIHSLYFPAFRTKMDAIPGRYTQLWFEATKVGTYHIFCTEYCGTNHSGMIGSVIVMEPAAYQAWLSGGTTEGTLAQRGERLFTELACSTCHLDTGKGRGPSLHDIVGKTGGTGRRLDRDRRRRLPARIDHQLAGEDREGLSAADAGLPGPGQRRQPGGAGRIREVAVADGDHARRDAGRHDPDRRSHQRTRSG